MSTAWASPLNIPTKELIEIQSMINQLVKNQEKIVSGMDTNYKGWKEVGFVDETEGEGMQGYSLSRPIYDEVHRFAKGGKVFMASTTDPVVKSKIRVTFNRPWTWSEREQFLTDLNDPENTGQFFSEGFTEKGTVLVIGSSHDDSRHLYNEIASYCEHLLVNQHPIAVLTLFPKEKM